MRRLWLHIGSHKTGTTTVQDTLMYNKDALHLRGLGFAHGDQRAHLHQFLGPVVPGKVIPQGYHVIDLKAFAERLADVPANEVFASSENFAFFFFQKPVDDLAAALRVHFDEVRILAYIRRQDRHAASHHQEGAWPDRGPEAELWGHSLTALPEALPHQRLYLDYNRRIGLWEKTFGHDNVTLRIYDRKHLVKQDIVSDVLQAIGQDEAGLERIADSNPGLGLLRAKTGHLANATLGDADVTLAIVRALPFDDAPMRPSAAQARAFLAPYLHSNRALAARFPSVPFRDLFPDDFGDYPETATDTWTEESATTALRAVIAVLGTSDGVGNAFVVEDMRMAAFALKETMPESALRFARAAHRIRPDLPEMVTLLQDIEEHLRLLRRLP